MADFNKCVDFVIGNEGGFVTDTGGSTNFGITAKYLMSNKLWDYDINKDGYIDQEEMKRFTKDDAIEVYKSLFIRNFYNMIDSNDVSMRVFDMCVNTGRALANKMLQNCYNETLLQNTPYDLKIKVKKLALDGIIGKKTIGCINTFPHIDKLLVLYKDSRAQYYSKLSESNPQKYGKYLTGWLKRAYR